MKRLLTLAIFAIVSLAACGGGGGGSITPAPGPTQTSPPTINYSAKIVFTGSLAGKAAQRMIQMDLRRAFDSGAATPPPIMVVSPPESGMDTSVYGGNMEAVVSPMPTASAATTFTQTNADAILQTPSPVPTGATPAPLPTGVVAQAQIWGANTPQTQSSGVATATIGSPVDQSPTTPVYSYMSIALDCNYSSSPVGYGVVGGQYTLHFGWRWNGSQWIPDDDASTADIYIDGPHCLNSGNPSESDATVHIPGGDARVSTDSPFSSITVAQWQNAETSFTIGTVIQANPDGSNNGLVIGKTRAGLIFKLFPNALQSGEGYFGGIEVSGSSIDGF